MRKKMIVMAMALGTAAQAQEGSRPMMSPACRTEMQNLCPQTEDRDARRACMMAKRDTLSATCKAEIAAMRARRGGGGRPEGGAPRGEMGGMGDMNGGGMGGGMNGGGMGEQGGGQAGDPGSQ
jgi:hypothetical protein